MPESLNAFEKCLDFILNAMKCDCGSIFVHYLHQVCFRNAIKCFLATVNNNIIHKHDKANVVNWGKLHMFSRQISIRLIHLVYTKCGKGCEFAKTSSQSIITTALHYS